jgi:hypothetical protein
MGIGRFFIGPVFCLLLMAQAAKAELALHGFLQGNYSLNTATANPDGRDAKLVEERAQLKLEADKDPFRLFLKTDLAWDHLDDEEDLELREGYLDYTGSAWDLRLGRQVVTWGLGDLIFINDVFPKDYEAFFAGRPLEYLKKGVDAVKAGLYPGPVSLEVVAIPRFTPNHYPDPGRFWLFDPLPTVSNRQEQEPGSSLAHTELALRAYREVAGFDGALYFYRGYFRQPAMQLDNPGAPTRITLFYPELSVYGASLSGSVLSGVLSLEAGYYDSRQDRDGDDPMITNSHTRLLLGYQRQPWEDFTVGVQYYGEWMEDYGNYAATLPPGLTREKRWRDLLSLRLTRLLIHQTLKLSCFAFYGPAEKDYLINPEIRYSFSDQTWAALGANLFGGEEPSSRFGQLDRNDNLYLQTRYEF